MLNFGPEYEFDPARDEAFFAALPALPGIFVLPMRDANAQPYLARTADIRWASQRLLRPPEPGSKRLNLRNIAAGIRYRVTGSRFEQSFVLYTQARACFPGTYGKIMRLRPPALLKVHLRNSYPRCYVTRRLQPGAFYWGPFASRKSADAFCEKFLDLFRIRRCKIKIRRDPHFPGCMYSEMKMCLAPCFAGCTAQEYRAEVDRMVEALDSAGKSFTDELQLDREAASDALDFERAALVHKRIEKVSATVRALPEIARRVDQINAAIVQRGAGSHTVIVFPVRSGLLEEPIILPFNELSSAPRSVEAILRAGLEDAAPRNQEDDALQRTAADRSEHLSLIARWFYSNPREGEILFRGADWPYRRILRACGRTLAPADAAKPLTPPRAPPAD
jgi:excinuclease ABC subunit C